MYVNIFGMIINKMRIKPDWMMLLIALFLQVLTLNAQHASSLPASNTPSEVSLFSNPDHKRQIGLFGIFADRTINKILQRTTEHEACLLISKLHVYLAKNGKSMNNVPRQWVSDLLKEKKDLNNLNFTPSATDFTISMSADNKPQYVFKALISREAIEGTDKAEAEELLFKALMTYKSKKHELRLPETNQLVKTPDTDLLVLEGGNYMTSTMNSDTYYELKHGAPMVVFNRKYPIESLKNLIQGKVKDRNYKLSFTMPLYGGKSHKAVLLLDDVLSYWLERENEYDVYCSVYSSVADSSDNVHTISVIISHRQLQYVNVLSLKCHDDVFENSDAAFDGIITAIIPQHNVNSLLK